jgi:transposase
MFFRKKRVGPYEYVVIAENKWVDGRVRQRTLLNLGRLEQVTQNGTIDSLMLSAAKFSEKLAVLKANLDEEVPLKNQKVIGPALVFEKLWKRTGIQKVIHSILNGRQFEFDVERAVFTTVLHRLMQSGSDLSCMRWLSRNRIPGTESLSLHHLYRAMDWLGAPIAEWNEADPLAERRTCHVLEEMLFLQNRDLFTSIEMVFFDTTSLYFEGKGGDDLGERGHSKDHRSGQAQMVVGIVLDQDGNPICSEIWPGSTTDVTVLLPVVERLKSRFHISSVCIVCDRGMISEQTIRELESTGIHYILGVRMRRCNEVKWDVLGRGGRYETVRPARQSSSDPAPLQVKNVVVDEQRYIVCLNPEEADADAKVREAIIESLESALKKGDKRLIGNKGYRRFLSTRGAHFEIDRKKVSEDARYDGRYVLRTDLDHPASDIALQYKQLWRVERVIRSIKSVLATRPVYHRMNETIRGHVFCSFLALILMKSLGDALAKDGHSFHWDVIRDELNHVTEGDLTVSGKTFRLRSEVGPEAAKAMLSAGAKFPQFISLVSQ